MVCIYPEDEIIYNDKYYISKKLAEDDLNKRNDIDAKLVEIETED